MVMAELKAARYIQSQYIGTDGSGKQGKPVRKCHSLDTQDGIGDDHKEQALDGGDKDQDEQLLKGGIPNGSDSGMLPFSSIFLSLNISSALTINPRKKATIRLMKI